MENSTILERIKDLYLMWWNKEYNDNQVKGLDEQLTFLRKSKREFLSAYEKKDEKTLDVLLKAGVI